MVSMNEIIYDVEWNIAFIDNTLKNIVEGTELHYHLLQNSNNNVWYADPFILDVDNKKICLLVEEFEYNKRLGRISKIEVDRNSYRILTTTSILSLPTHLSFPSIQRNEDQIFIMPENGQSGKLNLYKYNPITNLTSFHTKLLDVAVEDAIVTDIFGEKFLFCTKYPNANRKELLIYKKGGKKWNLFQTEIFGEQIARMAGDFFKIGDNIYRPAQDCNKCYGNGLVIQKVEYDGDKFYFTNITRYFSKDPVYKDGIHTLNSYNGITVVDFLGKARYPIIRRFLIKLGLSNYLVQAYNKGGIKAAIIVKVLAILEQLKLIR